MTRWERATRRQQELAQKIGRRRLKKDIFVAKEDARQTRLFDAENDEVQAKIAELETRFGRSFREEL